MGLRGKTKNMGFKGSYENVCGERSGKATRGQKKSWAKNSLGIRSGIFINCPKYSLASAALSLSHFYPSFDFFPVDSGGGE